MSTFADQIINFNNQLCYDGRLPAGIRIMNPFKEESVRELSAAFYHKYYNDNNKRRIILGINPGRFGGGTTGISFTDPKRLADICGIPYNGKLLHEPSSVFVYEMIKAYGGPEAFYSAFYIHSVCPLGFTNINAAGKEVNYNYYDSKELAGYMLDFIIDSIKKQLEFNIDKEICFCLGMDKNTSFLTRLNSNYRFFKKIVALDHPRFIMQYKSKSIQAYIDKYLDLLSIDLENKL